jgi:hypothetical protein
VLKAQKDQQVLREPKEVKEILMEQLELKVLKDRKEQLKEPQELKVMLVLQDLQVILEPQGHKELHHKGLKVLKVQQELKVPQVLMELKVLLELQELKVLKDYKELFKGLKELLDRLVLSKEYKEHKVQ